MSTDFRTLRLPSRLFDGENFILPLKGNPAAASQASLRFPRRLLEDSGLLHFIFAEFHGPGFEIEEREALCRLVPPGALFIDIGAHFGLFSVILSDAVSGIHCVAVEPTPETYSILVENIDGNGSSDRISSVRCAIGRCDGRQHLRPNSSMGNHLLGEKNQPTDKDFDVEVKSLTSLLAQEFCHRQDERPIWLKIDTEGRESDVLAGARHLFSQGRIGGVLWEYRVGHLVNPKKSEIISFFDEYDFQTTCISESNMLSCPA